ncbi:MAG: DUF971 domain-containing protein [Snodgrassella sp.]|nr:DUF971 domain-containing protein [Snodgrassella sp.]
MKHMIPNEIRLSHGQRVLILVYVDTVYKLTAEYLRVFSPSAEVQGHGIGQEVLQTGKRDVKVTAVTPVGNYAVKITFSDGHDSGLYDWNYLHALSIQQKERWAEYEKKLQMAGATRD